MSDCVNLKILYCQSNNIKTLDPLKKCINIEILNCSYNKDIVINCLSYLPNLKYLSCSYNNLTNLDFLFDCTKLIKLECNNNRISILDPISNLIDLMQLFCDNNRIISLDPLANCTKMKILCCVKNNIDTLEPLINCSNLEVLHCKSNRITTLFPLANCINLVELDCQLNQITSLDPLIYPRKLLYIVFTGNPIETPTIQVQRFLDRFQINQNTSVYHDKQNVHDIEIQRTVCDSIQALLSDSKTDFSMDMIINSKLKSSIKEALVQYCQDKTIHSIHLITYQELLSYVWNRIINSEHTNELMKILEEQITDSECQCFTGRFNRTLSVLVGFYNDIKINISDKSRISAIILNCKDRIIPYNSQLHRETSKLELIEAGYTETEIDPWISAIDEFEDV